MQCFEKTELERFLKGKLAPERMLEIDEHAGECEQCKKLLVGLSARAQFGAELIGAVDCPEYEELSAYIDESLGGERAEAVRVHANLCEPCANDIERIRELRSHALLRDKVTVRPGAMRQIRRATSPLRWWRQALAAAALGGVVAAVLFFNNAGTPVANAPKHMAKLPDVVNTQPTNAGNQSDVVKPVKPTVKPTPKPDTGKVAQNNAPKPAPAPVTVLRDGAYAVVAKNGAMSLANKNGKPPRTALESRVAANIDEKLRTGKIRLPKPVEMAMASIEVRGDNGYQAPPTAPKQSAPMGKVVLSANPTLSWSKVDLADSYRVTVYDSAGNLVAEQTTSGTGLTLAKPLARGKVYSWRVGVRFSETDGWVESGAAKFAVVSADDFNTIQHVRATLPGSHLALGAAYESAGLYDEAANEYRLLRRANPNSALAKKLLYGVVQH